MNEGNTEEEYDDEGRDYGVHDCTWTTGSSASISSSRFSPSSSAAFFSEGRVLTSFLACVGDVMVVEFDGG